MDREKHLRKIARTLATLLGRQPQELGLVPDAEGFVPQRDLFRALAEDSELRRIRPSNLPEIAALPGEPLVETRGDLIRAAQRGEIAPRPLDPEKGPKLLYTCVRRRAHAAVLEKGIHPGRHPRVILCAGEEMALRLGRRFDPQPVLLTVQVRRAASRGVRFEHLGESLYLSDPIPSDCFSAPPLPKAKDREENAPAPPRPSSRDSAGSFTIPWPPSPAGPAASRPRGKKPKRERKPPPWRS